MKTTSMVRNLDELGRYVVPVEIRRKLNIQNGDPLEVYTEGQKIILEPVKLKCVYCGSDDEGKLIEHRGVHICPLCLAELKGRY